VVLCTLVQRLHLGSDLDAPGAERPVVAEVIRPEVQHLACKHLPAAAVAVIPAPM